MWDGWHHRVRMQLVEELLRMVVWRAIFLGDSDFDSGASSPSCVLTSRRPPSVRGSCSGSLWLPISED